MVPGRRHAVDCIHGPQLGYTEDQVECCAVENSGFSHASIIPLEGLACQDEALPAADSGIRI